MAQDNMDFNRRRSFGNIPQYGLVKGTVAPGFVDYGQVLKKNIDIDDIIKARKLKEDEYAENIANSPADIDVAKVPDAYEAGLTDYLTELKMEYSEGAKLLRDNRVGSDAYKRGQELVRNSKGFMANLDKEYSALQSASLEDIKNIQQDMYSSGNDESNQINTGSMLLKGQLSPDKIYYQDGKMYIRGGGDDGKDIAFSDLRLRFLKDSASMGAMTTSYRGLVDNAIKSGRRFNDVTDGALINDILTKANSQGIRSIAYDYNFPIPGDVVSYAKSDRAQKIAKDKFNGDKNWIRDINNSDILRNDMLSYFNDVFKTAINAEADAYDKRLDEDFRRRLSLRQTGVTRGPSKDEIDAANVLKAYADTIFKANETVANSTYFKNNPELKNTPIYKQTIAEELISSVSPKSNVLVRTFDENTQNDFFKDDKIIEYFTSNTAGNDKLKDASEYLDYMLRFDINRPPVSTKIASEVGGNENGAIIKNKDNELVFNEDFLKIMENVPMGTGQRLVGVNKTNLAGVSRPNTKEGYADLIKEIRNAMFTAYTKNTSIIPGELITIQTDPKTGLKEYHGLKGDPSGSEEQQKEFTLSMFKADLLDRKKAKVLGIADELLDEIFGAQQTSPIIYNSTNF
jgi:hypothetical protein